MTTPTQRKHPVREGLVDAGIRLLADQGASALVMRRVAAAAGVSTMCVYSRFGDKAGLLDAILIAGSERLDSEMSSANEGFDPLEQIMSLAFAYRRFAMANSALYTLMFERTVEVGPPAEVQSEAWRGPLSYLVTAMEGAIQSGALLAESATTAAYILWTAVHGTVSLELANAAHSPFPGWFIDSPETGERVFGEVMETTLRGMTPVGSRDR